MIIKSISEKSCNQQPLPILYEDESLVAIHKPSGMMTHRSRIAEGQHYSAMEYLRDQLGSWVYPIHRLDRATSGVLIFGLHKDSARILHQQFADGLVEKKYWMITRGHAPIEAMINRALKEKRDRITDKKAREDKPAQTARTDIQTLAHVTLPIALSRYQTARFSLVEASPKTGRRHQIRRHLAGINYPIIGDTTHGRGEQNRFFRTYFDTHRLLLACTQISLLHPYKDQTLIITAPLYGVMEAVCRQLFFGGSELTLSAQSIAETVQLSVKIDWLTDSTPYGHFLASSQA